MAEEQPQTAVPAPVQGVPPVPAKGKSNTTLIVIIVLIVVFGVLVGGYMAYRFLKGKVKTAMNDVTTTSTNSDGSTTTTSTSLTNSYTDSKDLTPADDFGKSINGDVKPILNSLYGGVKLITVSSQSSGAALYYLTKNNPAVTDGDKISAELAAKGYKQDTISTSNDGYVLAMSKGASSLVISFAGQQTVGVIASVVETIE